MPDDLDDLLSRTTIEVPDSLLARVEAMQERERPDIQPHPKGRRRPRQMGTPLWAAAALALMVIAGGLLVLRGDPPVVTGGPSGTAETEAISPPPPTLTLTPAPPTAAPRELPPGIRALNLPETDIAEANAAYILFERVLLYDRQADDLSRLIPNPQKDFITTGAVPAMSTDASVVAYWGYSTEFADECGQADLCGSVYVLDRSSSDIQRIPVGVQGRAVDLALSADGRFVGFAAPDGQIRSGAFVYDRGTDVVSRVARGGRAIALSDDGRFAAVVTTNELIEADVNAEADVYLIDRLTGVIVVVSRSLDGQSGVMGEQAQVAISSDGQMVAFHSTAQTLVQADFSLCQPGCQQIYLYDWAAESVRLISRSEQGAAADGLSFNPIISPGGRYVAYTTEADNLDPAFSCAPCAAIYDIEAGTTRIIPDSRAITWGAVGELIIEAEGLFTVAVEG